MIKNNEREEVKNQIGIFSSQYYKKTGRIPSIGKIVKKTGFSRAVIYEVFPGGQAEIRMLAGIPSTVPIPTGPVNNRVLTPDSPLTFHEANQLALAADSGRASRKISLTEAQTDKVLAASYLEGKDPQEIINRLLESDAKRRRGFPDLSLEDEFSTLAFLAAAKARGWNESEFLDFMTQVYNLGLNQLSPTIARSLIQLSNELVVRKWNISQFIDEAKRSGNIINWYARYRRGETSGELAAENIFALGE
jgi:hypothetical protein